MNLYSPTLPPQPHGILALNEGQVTSWGEMTLWPKALQRPGHDQEGDQAWLGSPAAPSQCHSGGPDGHSFLRGVAFMWLVRMCGGSGRLHPPRQRWWLLVVTACKNTLPHRMGINAFVIHSFPNSWLPQLPD